MFYKRHILFCTNNKGSNGGCGHLGGSDAIDIIKKQLKDHDMWGEGKVRANKVGCQGRCSEGPVCVVYPEGTWYTFVDKADLKEITKKHLINGKVVSRLKI